MCLHILGRVELLGGGKGAGSQRDGIIVIQSEEPLNANVCRRQRGRPRHIALRYLVVREWAKEARKVFGGKQHGGLQWIRNEQPSFVFRTAVDQPIYVDQRKVMAGKTGTRVDIAHVQVVAVEVVFMVGEIFQVIVEFRREYGRVDGADDRSLRV